LIEGQERNTVQLERIGAVIEKRYSLGEENRKEESENEEEGSKDGPGESQEEGTPVKNKRSRLNIFLFSSFIFILFLIYFSLFYF